MPTSFVVRRLVLNFVLLALIAVAIALIAVLAVQFTSDTLLRVSARSDTALLSAHIRSESLALTELVQRYTQKIDGEPNLRQQIKEQQTRLDALVQRAINATDPHDVDESMAVGRVRQSLLAFSVQSDHVLATFDAEGTLGPATENEPAVLVKNYQEPLVSALSDLEQFETERVQQVRAQARRLVQAMLTALIAIIVLVSALTVGIITEIIVRVATPLTLLRRGVEQIRQGRLDQPVPISRHDEMGQLAEALNTMSAEVRHYQEHLEDLVRERTAELATANCSLQENEEQFRKMFEANPFPLVITRLADSTIVLANQAAADYVEITLAELLATRLLAYYADPSERQSVLDEVQARGRVVNRLLELRSQTGARKVALANVFPIGLFGEACLLTGLADVTERKRIEEAEREQRTLAEALRDAAGVLTSTLDLNDVLDRIIEQANRVVPGDATSIQLIEGDIARVVRRLVRHGPGEALFGTIELSITTPGFQFMIATAQPWVVPDTYADPSWVCPPKGEWIRSYAGAPIQVQGQVIGFLNVNSATPGFFTSQAAGRLRAFADQAAIAIRNAQLFDETRHRAEHMATLNRIGQAITAGLDIDHVLGSLYDQCLQVISTDSFYIALYDAGTGLIRFPLFRDQGQVVEMGSYNFQTRHGLTDHVIQTRRTLYLPDTLHPDTIGAFQIIHAGGAPARSYVGVPLILRDEVLGVLSVQSYQLNAYGPDQIGLLETIATQAAVAIENARLYTEARMAQEVAEAANAELLVRNRELDSFAHTVAHDLKNPVGLIFGHAELLAEAYADLPPQQIYDSAQVIARTAGKLDTIVEELMLLAGVRNQKVKIEPVNMGDVINEALLRLTGIIQEKEAQIIWPDVSAWPKAFGHAPWVEEVWVNYISNALKYGGTPSSPPRVELGVTLISSARDGEGMQDQVRFWVRDNGRGLTPDQQSKLFAPFERLEYTRVRGYGLGLSIARRIVEKLGGQVGVESQVGQGSTFYFTLPAVDNASDRLAQDAGKSKGG